MLRLLGRSARGLLAPAALAVASATAVATCDGPAGATTGAPGVASAAPSGRAPSPADSAVAMPQRLVVMNSRAVRALSTHIRDKSSDTLTFATYADRLMTLLMEETLASLGGVTEADVATPCGTYAGLRALPRSDLAFVSIVRAGDSMLQAARALEPGVVVGKILIQRDEASVEKRAVLVYSKLPHNIAQKKVVLLDPMLASGGSAIRAIAVLLERGVKEENITLVNVVAVPEGLRALAKVYPRVAVVVAEMDAGLNEEKYIVPGLGDFGDRYFGTLEH